MQLSIENMTSYNGNTVPNQFIVNTKKGTYFQSYSTIIAHVSNSGQVTLSNKYKTSNTTGKYRSIFLDEDLTTTEKKIKSGEYQIVSKIQY